MVLSVQHVQRLKASKRYIIAFTRYIICKSQERRSRGGTNSIPSENEIFIVYNSQLNPLKLLKKVNPVQQISIPDRYIPVFIF